ncbi:hypothetical protein RHMOL_Rhmol06G0116000 [Rhododendron molle]|uniref:Uncharacterized protein n=1 Tax=Rhododendron molle TaxID=49168 RepID=A0ACC0NB46_RHOML|nr:hypothetical protein RHMOL_Rhmol06G0116000 [Rhododendron molle]
MEQLCPYMAPSDDCSIMVLDAPPVNLWDVDEIIDVDKNPLPDNLWDVDKIIDINMGNEVWTVNTASMDRGFWDVLFVTNLGTPFKEVAAQDPPFWEGLVMDDLEWDLTPRQDSSTMTVVDLKLDGWIGVDLKLDGWIVFDLKLDGWIVVDLKLDGWIVVDLTLDGWIVFDLKVDGWIVVD